MPVDMEHSSTRPLARSLLTIEGHWPMPLSWNTPPEWRRVLRCRGKAACRRGRDRTAAGDERAHRWLRCRLQAHVESWVNSETYDRCRCCRVDQGAETLPKAWQRGLWSVRMKNWRMAE